MKKQFSLDQSRQSKMLEDPITPAEEQSREVQEVDVPQNIEIRHGSASISPLNQLETRRSDTQSNQKGQAPVSDSNSNDLHLIKQGKSESNHRHH